MELQPNPVNRPLHFTHSRSGDFDRDWSCCVYFRRRCWQFFTRAEDAGACVRTASIAYEICMCIFVALLFFLGTYQEREIEFFILESVLTSLYSIEYVLKLFSCIEDDSLRVASLGQCWRTKARLQKAREPLMICDLLMISALAAEQTIFDGFAALRFLRIFRILTLFRLEKVLHVFEILLEVGSQRRDELAATFLLAMMMLLVVSSAMFYIESPTNQEFSSLWTAMWWGTTALTTVGYGDIYPTTGAGKILGSIVAFMGVGLFALPAGILASGFQEVVEARKRAVLAKNQATASESKEPIESSDLTDIVMRLESRTRELHNEVVMVRTSQQSIMMEQKRVADLLEQMLLRSPSSDR